MDMFDAPPPRTSDGLLHRETGPIMTEEGPQFWIFGEHVSEEEFWQRMPRREVGKDGVIRWTRQGGLHRLYGPAVEHPHGEVEYWIEGMAYSSLHYHEVVPHRQGHRWIRDGHNHRTDGPAAYFPFDGLRIWRQEGLLHREDGPAILFDENGKKTFSIQEGFSVRCGDQMWFYQGKKHRRDGPAVIRADGTKEYWIKGSHIPASDWKEPVQEAPLRGLAVTELWTSDDLEVPSPFTRPQGILHDLMIKAKWDALISVFRVTLGWPSHPLLDVLCKTALAAALHHGASSREVRWFAEDAIRVTFLQEGLALLRALSSNHKELEEVLQSIPQGYELS